MDGGRQSSESFENDLVALLAANLVDFTFASAVDQEDVGIWT